MGHDRPSWVLGGRLDGKRGVQRQGLTWQCRRGSWHTGGFRPQGPRRRPREPVPRRPGGGLGAQRCHAGRGRRKRVASWKPSLLGLTASNRASASARMRTGNWPWGVLSTYRRLTKSHSVVEVTVGIPLEWVQERVGATVREDGGPFEMSHTLSRQSQLWTSGGPCRGRGTRAGLAEP